MVTLGNARGRGLLTENEVNEYLSKGYTLDSPIEIETGRPGFMTFISYQALDAAHTWTIDSGETQLCYIGSKQNLTNAGSIINNGELMCIYNTGTIVNTGLITNTGILTLRELA